MAGDIGEHKLSEALKAEAESRRRITSTLSKYLLNPGVPVPVKIMVLGILACLTAFSVLITILLIHVGHAAYADVNVDFHPYLYTFCGIFGMLFVIVILFGRQAVDFEHYHRTAQGFRQAALARSAAE